MSILNYIDLDGEEARLAEPAFPPPSPKHDNERDVEEVGELFPAAKRPRVAPPRIVAMLRTSDAYVRFFFTYPNRRRLRQWNRRRCLIACRLIHIRIHIHALHLALSSS